MNLIYITAAWSSNYTMLIVLAVLMVVMLVMSIIPQRKRQKESQKMMESLTIGTKIKTIGGFVGEIVSIDTTTNIMVIDISPNFDKSSLCNIDKSAVYAVMQTNSNGTIAEIKEEPIKALDDAADDQKKVDLEAKSEKKDENKDNL